MITGAILAVSNPNLPIQPARMTSNQPSHALHHFEWTRRSLTFSPGLTNLGRLSQADCRSTRGRITCNCWSIILWSLSCFTPRCFPRVVSYFPSSTIRLTNSILISSLGSVPKERVNLDDGASRRIGNPRCYRAHAPLVRPQLNVTDLDLHVYHDARWIEAFFPFRPSSPDPVSFLTNETDPAAHIYIVTLMSAIPTLSP